MCFRKPNLWFSLAGVYLLISLMSHLSPQHNEFHFYLLKFSCLLTLPTPIFGLSLLHPPVFILLCPLWGDVSLCTLCSCKSCRNLVQEYTPILVFCFFILSKTFYNFLQLTLGTLVFILCFPWCLLGHYCPRSPEWSLSVLLLPVFLYSFMPPSFLSFSYLCLHIPIFLSFKTGGRIRFFLWCFFPIAFFWNSSFSLNLNSFLFLLNILPKNPLNFLHSSSKNLPFNLFQTHQIFDLLPHLWLYSWPSPNYFLTIPYTEIVLTKEVLMASSWTNWMFFHLGSSSFLEITLSMGW